jgi:predicted nuclease with TOPRIM domain
LGTIILERQEWEQLVEDTERLVSNYEKLLGRVKELEAAKKSLEERLAAGEAQQQELQQKVSVLRKEAEVDDEEVSTIRELRSRVSRLLKESEKMRVG